MSFSFTDFRYTNSALWGGAPFGVAILGKLKPLSPLGNAVGGNPKPWQQRPDYLACLPSG